MRAVLAYFDPATADPDFPDVTPRDAQALREIAGGGARGARRALIVGASAAPEQASRRPRAEIIELDFGRPRVAPRTAIEVAAR